jgi:hypothetical protein
VISTNRTAAKLESVAERTPVTLAIKEGLAMTSTYE